MKFINTKMHAVLDYLSAMLLMASPWIFNFHNTPGLKWAAILLGLIILVMSICTEYEAGIFKIVPMPVHLWGDMLLGIFMIALPWILNIAGAPRVLFVTLGIIAILASLFTYGHKNRTVT
ncbi:hypothetical protein GS399_06305 [Pedobacter sp. HMF7647]|uniref:SPW repeat-containing integral membrane domain-containing protein n=1 Tax=Hufsiella arboris TaxID=2695275 RepID=A0A7K1Y920_9SPHI|nr:SPW repeat protein [Hufsiella arboris]MXV50579.1 hypothetical protein [Hufsiella arboris]